MLCLHSRNWAHKQYGALAQSVWPFWVSMISFMKGNENKARLSRQPAMETDCNLVIKVARYLQEAGAPQSPLLMTPASCDGAMVYWRIKWYSRQDLVWRIWGNWNSGQGTEWGSFTFTLNYIPGYVENTSCRLSILSVTFTLNVYTWLPSYF